MGIEPKERSLEVKAGASGAFQGPGLGERISLSPYTQNPLAQCLNWAPLYGILVAELISPKQCTLLVL